MKRIVSGITPSAQAGLHIGNYLGAVKQFKQMAAEHECFLFIADLHALTTVQKKEALKQNIETLILHELSLLGDLKNIVFYRQSDIPQHSELQTILNNYTPLGLIKRAHAYKDKLQKEVNEDEINMGLFNYPILMASDILLYKPDFVPVGKDQKQHIEITRDIAERFNKTYKSNTFPLPEGIIPEDVATILGTDGQRKMSKSLGNIISIFEEESIIKKQVMSCYTDPTRKSAHDKGHIEGNMVFTYLDFFGDKNHVAALKDSYVEGGVGDVEVKEYLYQTLIEYFRPARERYASYKSNPKAVKEILSQGTEKAISVATKTIAQVHEAIGLANAYSYSFASSTQAKAGQGSTFEHDGYITIDEFAKVSLRVGIVTAAENVEKSEKLIRLHVDFSNGDHRVIFTGVRGYGYTPDHFAGKQFFFVTNLLPRKMVGEESQGMILAVDGLELPMGVHGDAKPIFISAEGLPIGSKIR